MVINDELYHNQTYILGGKPNRRLVSQNGSFSNASRHTISPW